MLTSVTQKAATKKRPQKNSVVKNINAKKNAGTSRYKSKTAFSKNAYSEIENIWSE